MDLRQASRGFTLIELMIALGMALAVTTAAFTILLLAVDTQRDGSVRQSLARDAQLAMDVLTKDLQYLGVGVPYGFAVDTDLDVLGSGGVDYDDCDAACFTAVAPDQLRPALRIGRADYLAFIGDIAFPHADLNGLSAVTELSPARGHRVAIASELSTCAAPDDGASNYACSTTAASMLDVGGGDCSDSANDEPTCPWGLKKYAATCSGTGDCAMDVGKVPLIVGGYHGAWTARSWDGRLEVASGGSERVSLHLEHEHPPGGAGSRNDEDIEQDLFVGNRIGLGFVSHVDRVFYALTGPGETAAGSCDDGERCVLHRKQCWGMDIENTRPSQASFPAVAASPIDVGDDPVDCDAADDEGTPWEMVASDITSLVFRYYDATGAELSVPLTAEGASRARIIEVELVLERAPKQSTTFQERLVRRIYLEHGGGLITPNETARIAVTAGGCWQAGPAHECRPR